MGIFWSQKKFFHAAASGDEKTVARYLADDRTWSRAQDKKTGEYALLLAAKNGHAGIVAQLLKAGAPAWCSDNSSRTALHYAATGGHTETVRTLLENGAASYIGTQDNRKMSPLLYAIAANRAGVVKIFLDTKGADLNAGGKPALYTAVESKSRDCLAMLLAAGADPNVPRVETRRDHGRSSFWGWSESEPKVFRQSPLQCACALNDEEMVRMLLKAGAKPLDDEFPIHAAARNGNVSLMTALIVNGFKARALNAELKTALHTAVESKAAEGLTETVTFLLAQGVDKEAKDSGGRTALSYAQQYALTDVVKLLQNPPPEIAPEPVAPVVKPVPAAIASPPPPVPASRDDDTWFLSGKASIVHSTVIPVLNRRLTEIFNFETRERLSLTENLSAKTETMGPHESFDTVSDEALRQAYGEFKKRGGAADESAVFGGRLLKMKVKPA